MDNGDTPAIALMTLLLHYDVTDLNAATSMIMPGDPLFTVDLTYMYYNRHVDLTQ